MNNSRDVLYIAVGICPLCKKTLSIEDQDRTIRRHCYNCDLSYIIDGGTDDDGK